jgi:hypothetical protein
MEESYNVDVREEIVEIKLSEVWAGTHSNFGMAAAPPSRV